MSGLIEWMMNLINGVGQSLVHLLPLSPFKDFIDNFAIPQYVGYINWFFPVTAFLNIVAVWLSAIALFYIYSIIMRWVKMLGD